MASWIDARLSGEYKGAGLSDFGGPWLVIHVDALSLTDEELGKAARGCADAAWYAEARNRADWICSYMGRKPWDMSHDILAYEELLLKHQGKHSDIDLALYEINRLKLYIKNKETKPVRRADVQRNYDNLFVKIGRRDSFKCKQCGSSDNLAIDHIHALANGGSNDLDNLQLLCRTCNSSKGAR